MLPAGIIVGVLCLLATLLFIGSRPNAPQSYRAPTTKGQYVRNTLIQGLGIGSVVFGIRYFCGAETSFAFWVVRGMGGQLLEFLWCVLSFIIAIVAVDVIKGKTPFQRP
jgi:uncharacterized membrane protein YedE/YeeE